MASTTPLRPIAVSRHMRSPQPIQLTIARGPEAGGRQSNAFASNHSGSSALVMRLLGRSFGFRQHLAAFGGRREGAAPMLSMDLRRRLRRSPAPAMRSGRVVRWPWSAPPSVAIPLRHEQFVGRAVLPDEVGWAESEFDGVDLSVADLMSTMSEMQFDVGDANGEVDWDDASASAPDSPMTGLEFHRSAVDRRAPAPLPGLAGIRPIVRRAPGPDLLLSVPHLANRIVADHATVHATSPEILARQIARSEQRAFTMSQMSQEIPLSSERPREAMVLSRQSDSQTTPGALPSFVVDANDLPGRVPYRVSAESPANFTLDLLRHLSWSPAQQSRPSTVWRTSFAPAQVVDSGGIEAPFDPGGSLMPFGALASPFGWSNEPQGSAPARSMQIPPIATPLVASLPSSTLSSPAMPNVWRSLGETSSVGLPFAGRRSPSDRQQTEATAPSLLPSFVADRLAQASRLISPETVSRPQSSATESASGSTATGPSWGATSPSPMPAEFSLPEMPVVARRADFATRHAQQALDGPTSPVWGSLGRQVQVEQQSVQPLSSGAPSASPLTGLASAVAPLTGPGSPLSPLSGLASPVSRSIPSWPALPSASSAHAERSWSAGSPWSAPLSSVLRQLTPDTMPGGFVSRLPLASSRSVFAPGNVLAADRVPEMPFFPSAPFFPRAAIGDSPRTSSHTSTSSPSSTASYPSTPMVYRSPLVDRAEPDDVQQAEAGNLLSVSTGAPLPTVIRRSMEQRLGMDLAAVRVHSGPGVMRAANLVAARSMARGSDVFLPGGMPESPTSSDMPLLAHELTHVAHHQGHQPPPTSMTTQRSPMPMTTVRPMTLARRTSDQEQEAEQIERRVADDIREFRRSPTTESAPSPELTLPRTIASQLQRAGENVAAPTEPVTATVSVPSPAAPDAAAAGPSAAELADQVYHLLERRLIVERERGGYRR